MLCCDVIQHAFSASELIHFFCVHWRSGWPSDVYFCSPRLDGSASILDERVAGQCTGIHIQSVRHGLEHFAFPSF